MNDWIDPKTGGYPEPFAIVIGEVNGKEVAVFVGYSGYWFTKQDLNPVKITRYKYSEGRQGG